MENLWNRLDMSSCESPLVVFYGKNGDPRAEAAAMSKLRLG